MEQCDCLSATYPAQHQTTSATTLPVADTTRIGRSIQARLYTALPVIMPEISLGGEKPVGKSTGLINGTFVVLNLLVDLSSPRGIDDASFQKLHGCLLGRYPELLEGKHDPSRKPGFVPYLQAVQMDGELRAAIRLLQFGTFTSHVVKKCAYKHSQSEIDLQCQCVAR